MTTRNSGLVLWALALPAVACGPPDFSSVEQPTDWSDVPGARWRSLTVEGTGAGFESIPPEWSGITFANALTDESLLENQMRTNGSGVAVGDVDGDGRLDIYLARLDGSNALYRNLGNWRFEDATEASGLAAANQFSTGVTLVDADGDGDLDLILTSLGGAKSLYLNDGEGRFSESPKAGLLGPSGAMSIALADIDGDLDLDLYITNYKRVSVLDLFSPEEGAFPNTVRETEDGYEVTEAFRPHYEIVERAGVLSRREKAEPDELYLNDGRGRFEHVAFESGAFLDTDGAPLGSAPLDWGLAARFGDLDDDGDPDLYVANDLHSPDRLWINQGDGSFLAIPAWSLRTSSASSMAVDFSDIDRDGDQDVFVIDMLSRSSRLRKTQAPVSRVEHLLPGESGTQQANRNTLLVNRGDGTFTEVANYAGVAASDWSWSAIFLDVDLDGYEDLLISNGHIRDLMDADTQIRVQSLPLEDARQSILLYEPLPTHNVAFRNRGDHTFEETGAAWGVAPEPDVSHGTALGDFDGDGDLDAVVNRLGKPALLLRNDAAAARLAVRLVGHAPNTSAVGATIRVDVPGLPRQSKEIASGGAYLSGSDVLAVFAMGSATEATIEVVWPEGSWSSARVEGPNRLYEISAPVGVEADLFPAQRFQPWFELDPSFDPRHHDVVVDEAGRQPLLPLRLGQSGPSLAWHDLDADGDPDLLMGNGAGAAPVLFRNDGGSLTAVTLDGPVAPVDQTAVIPLAGGGAQPDGAGRIRVLVGLSSYEAPTAEAPSVPGVIALEWEPGALASDTLTPRVAALAPGAPSATGPIAVADYDGDGRLDLFVGGRVIPGRYPEAATSRVFRGQPNGVFEPDLRDTVFEGLGLVSGALFSDVDSDGDPDLVVATEWGPVRVLRNHRGRFTDVTDEVGLASHTSRWNAVAAGDFDGDGRPDLIATSWGENTEYQATADRPLAVYFGDVDRNGVLEVIEAQHDVGRRGVVPLAGLGRLAAGMPSVLERTPTHAAYADASVEDVVGVEPEGHMTITGLSHTLFLNRGDRFEARRLPTQAQWSPSLGMVVADANGDGAEDVFLAQNFFATDEDTPRYDSGRGLWLEGDGAGGFTAVSAARSGIAVYGDQRGVAVADVNGDGRIDLAIGQNGDQARLYLNTGGQVGLRVRLVGSVNNPFGIGASLRIAYGSERGPVREIRAGSGTGSHDDPIQVLGLSGEPTGIEIRWPDGTTELVDLEPGQRDITVRAAGARSPR